MNNRGYKLKMVKRIFKKSIYGVLSLIASLTSHAQQSPAKPLESRPPATWKPDTAYTDVIAIDDEFIATLNGSYLIDLPLRFDERKSYTFFLSNARIPVWLFKDPHGFYPCIRDFVLIVPDVKYYNAVAGLSDHTHILCAEPLLTNYYYHIHRGENGVQVDSVRIQGNGHSVITYRDVDTDLKGSLPVYGTEPYKLGVADSLQAIAQKQAAFIRNFEGRHHLSITGIYRQYNIREGTVTYYYTLAGMTAQQRLLFLLEKRLQWIKKHKGQAATTALFTPEILPADASLILTP